MLEGYKSNNNVVYSSKYHVIWRPKYRRNVLDPPIAKRLEEVLRAACKRSRADIIAQEIMPDQKETFRPHACLYRLRFDWRTRPRISEGNLAARTEPSNRKHRESSDVGLRSP